MKIENRSLFSRSIFLEQRTSYQDLAGKNDKYFILGYIEIENHYQKEPNGDYHDANQHALWTSRNHY